MSNYYEVTPLNHPPNCTVEVPGSKSITNRALLLASMADGRTTLENVLFSDDSRSFIDCLQSLGYALKVDESAKTVEVNGGIPQSGSRINVRSAGTSARFITALLAAHEGSFTVDASLQMKNRPMQSLLSALVSLGCKIEYLEREGFLPYKIHGARLKGGEVSVDSAASSQFTSGLLMTGCLHQNDLIIRPKSKEIAKSYIDITLTMMEQFGGAKVGRVDGAYVVKAGGKYTPQAYKIEPDLSTACYFYAAAALTQGAVLVKDVHFSSMQGDIKFLSVLERMGCVTSETAEGIMLRGTGNLAGVDVDMNDFSDQTMTLAALAPFANSPTTIRNIAHIKHQESDRIQAILTELTRLGVPCEEIRVPNGGAIDGIKIHPAPPKPTTIETYDDHRMAMAFSLIGLRTEGIKIANPACVGKTFEGFFGVLEGLNS
ncbi:MAG: 3-phosphoshikimate 1-carboxyvinyltransferase [Oscillospiraceae bacterium]|nr:3-phosphoshikimate 1-carboxyvinyltransferase [Oscillospiraceae bacterium]